MCRAAICQNKNISEVQYNNNFWHRTRHSNNGSRLPLFIGVVNCVMDQIDIITHSNRTIIKLNNKLW